MFVVGMAVALVGYVAYPTAPPRFFPEWGFQDAVANFTGVDPNSNVQVNALFNPYAAVPSMHCCNALIIGWSLAQMCKWRPARIAWGFYPVIMFWVVVATGNHWTIDAFLGAAPPPWLLRCPVARTGTSRGVGLHPAGDGLGLMDPRAVLSASPPSRRGRCGSAVERRAIVRNRLIESRLTPNAISLTGLVLSSSPRCWSPSATSSSRAWRS